MSLLCAACGQAAPSDEAPCPHCGGAVPLHDRYLLEAIVGQGAAGVTYRARDRDGAVVAIKEMPLRHTDPELARRMAREAKVLSELHHDRIPAYVEHFTQGVGKKQVFYLVQGFVEGPTLAEEMARRRYTEAEVLGILGEVCEVLSYLHRLMPPVVHRDVKLKNLIRRKSDGKLVLIDFGAVRDVATDPRLGGSTVAGTYGYMAPEQYKGEAEPRSDLYALGVLAVVLLTRRDPLDLVKPDHSLDWRPHVHASAGLRDLIDALLAADPAKRPGSADDVVRRLKRIAAGDFEPRAPAPLPPAPPAPPGSFGAPHGVVGRSRKVAILLGILGSPLGVHWWYLGRPLFAILSMAFVWTGLPIIASLLHAVWLWMRGEARFNQRYNPAALLESDTSRRTREVEALHTLFMKGALSQAEFEREKARILGVAPMPLEGLLRQVERGGLGAMLARLQDLPNVIEADVRQQLQHRRGKKRRHGEREGEGPE